MEKQKQKGILETKEISIHYGIKWIAESIDKPEEITAINYPKNVDTADLKIAEIMRSEFPAITKDLLKGTVKDVRITKEDLVMFLTPPRPYEQWIYDCLKSDICVIGPKDKEAEINKEFNLQKEIAMENKKVGLSNIDQIKNNLDVLVEKGLVNGVLGRGSYFGKNGFPTKNDYVDLVLLTLSSSAKNEKTILDVLKQTPRFAVTIIKGKNIPIKEGEHPGVKFIIVSEDTVAHAHGIKYEKYVLEDSIGIDLPHLSKEASEGLAKKFVQLLPKEDRRAGMPRFPPNFSG